MANDHDAAKAALQRLRAANPVAADILLFLTDHMTRHDAVTCSQAVLCGVTGKSRTTVHRAISFLKETGSIGMKKLGGVTVFHREGAAMRRGDAACPAEYVELNAHVLLDLGENPDLKSSHRY